MATALKDLLDSHGNVTFNPTELGLEDSRIVSLVDVQRDEDKHGVLSVSISCNEELAFHGNLEASIRNNSESFCTWRGDDALFIADGDYYTLTDEAWTALQRVLAHRYEAENISEESGIVRFDLFLTVPDTLTDDQLGNEIWERSKLVHFINESDPGTFGAQYLFGSIITEAMEA